ncbi:MAG TPA: hypothetical protein VFO10_17175 [Oligoflexus sp.]|uniref:hypothetical protein n=1 Tax=Oligoflexus sp. TaxID=1971216 RepID=UPI002D7E69C3|nr:hypothetical protein [Oligoflexus sp.]HET9238993.1 hypothetical protein [Oligoflexus sp.]
MLKYIIIASFGMTGTLFFLSKPRSVAQKAVSLNVPELTAEPSKPVSTVKKPTQPVAPAESLKYAALLPIGAQAESADSRRNRPRDDFYQKYVQATVRSCYDELVKRR